MFAVLLLGAVFHICYVFCQFCFTNLTFFCWLFHILFSISYKGMRVKTFQQIWNLSILLFSSVRLYCYQNWWVLCPSHIEKPDSEATGFSQRKVFLILKAARCGDGKKAQIQLPEKRVEANLKNKVRRDYAYKYSLILTQEVQLHSLESKSPQVMNVKEGRKEQSNFNLAEFDWSVLYVSIFGRGTGSSY